MWYKTRKFHVIFLLRNSTNIFICNQGICIKIPFILVQNLNQSVILGTPSLSLIKSFTVDNEVLKTNFIRQKLILKFIHQPFDKILDFLKIQTISQIVRKQKQIEYLKEEVRFKRIKEQPNDPKIIKTIQTIKNELATLSYFDLPNAF